MNQSNHYDAISSVLEKAVKHWQVFWVMPVRKPY